MYLEIREFSGSQIRLNGMNNEIAWCDLHDGSNRGILLNINAGGTIVGPGNRIAFFTGEAIEAHASVRVIDNDIHNAQFGVAFYAGSSTSQVIRNRLWAHGVRPIQIILGISNIDIWHNTLHGGAQNAIQVSNSSTGIDVRNNIFATTGDYAVDGPASGFTAFDFNDYFGQTTAPCSCGLSGASSRTLDPRFRDAAGADFRLLPTSPVIDVATPLTVDANGPGPGNFTGAAPDMGAHEYP